MLLFSKQKNLLVFPVNYNVKKGENNYGQYQGVYVYNIDLVHGFNLKGKVTHQDISGTENAGSCPIDRQLYIDDNLYTMSSNVIKVNSLMDLKEISRLIINNN